MAEEPGNVFPTSPGVISVIIESPGAAAALDPLMPQAARDFIAIGEKMWVLPASERIPNPPFASGKRYTKRTRGDDEDWDECDYGVTMPAVELTVALSATTAMDVSSDTVGAAAAATSDAGAGATTEPYPFMEFETQGMPSQFTSGARVPPVTARVQQRKAVKHSMVFDTLGNALEHAFDPEYTWVGGECIASIAPEEDAAGSVTNATAYVEKMERIYTLHSTRLRMGAEQQQSMRGMMVHFNVPFVHSNKLAFMSVRRLRIGEMSTDPLHPSGREATINGRSWTYDEDMLDVYSMSTPSTTYAPPVEEPPIAEASAAAAAAAAATSLPDEVDKYSDAALASAAAMSAVPPPLVRMAPRRPLPPAPAPAPVKLVHPREKTTVPDTDKLCAEWWGFIGLVLPDLTATLNGTNSNDSDPFMPSELSGTTKVLHVSAHFVTSLGMRNRNELSRCMARNGGNTIQYSIVLQTGSKRNGLMAWRPVEQINEDMTRWVGGVVDDPLQSKKWRTRGCAPMRYVNHPDTWGLMALAPLFKRWDELQHEMDDKTNGVMCDVLTATVTEHEDDLGEHVDQSEWSMIYVTEHSFIADIDTLMYDHQVPYEVLMEVFLSRSMVGMLVELTFRYYCQVVQARWQEPDLQDMGNPSTHEQCIFSLTHPRRHLTLASFGIQPGDALYNPEGMVNWRMCDMYPRVHIRGNPPFDRKHTKTVPPGHPHHGREVVIRGDATRTYFDFCFDHRYVPDMADTGTAYNLDQRAFEHGANCTVMLQTHHSGCIDRKSVV